MRGLNGVSPTEAYHRWYYDTGVWRRVRFLGVGCLKSVSDMWNYQELLVDLRPSVLVEFGTADGGSTLFFASVLTLVAHRFRVLTVDVNHSHVAPSVRVHPDIELMTCTSTSPAVAAMITELRCDYPGKLFAILDSDHTMDHVLAEMCSLREVMRSGDYLVVEDGNINGHPVLPNAGPGPWEALQEYERLFPDDFVRDTERETKFGFTFAPRGFLVRR